MARRLRVLATAGAATVVAVILAGCVTIGSQTVNQPNGVGPVQIKTVIDICQINLGTPPPACTADTDAGQLLLGYRVPNGTTTPESFVGSTPTQSVTFARSTSYTNQLEALLPSGPGEQWLGYIANPVFAPAGDHTLMTVSPQFVPPSADPTTFTYRSVVGARHLDGTHLVGAAVNCDGNAFAGSATTLTQCITDPASAGVVNTDQSIQTNEVQASAGSPPSVYPGDTASVPFDLKLLGPASSVATFALSATTNLAGATASPGAANQALNPGDNAQSVKVPVPLNAAAGTYSAGLTALNGAQSRSATGSFNVLALPNAPLPAFKGKTVTVSKGSASFGLVCAGGSGVIDPCNGTLDVVSSKPVAAKKAKKKVLKFGSGKFNLAIGSSGKVKIKLTKKGLAYLKKHGKAKVTLTITALNRAGAKNVLKTSGTLKNAKKKHKKK
jgi:hypothetical protein